MALSDHAPARTVGTPKQAPDPRATTPARILTIDIETMPHLAWIWDAKTRYVTPDKIERRGGVASFAAKWYGERGVEFRSTFDDGDRGMFERLHEMLDEADIVVGYNSDRFDITRIRGEFARRRMSEPSPVRSVDLIKTVRRFGWPYVRLDEVAKELGLPGKVAHQGFDLWLQCLADDPKAWTTMRRYNIQDVRLTELVYDAIRPFIKGHPNLGLWAGYDADGRPMEVCANCGSTNLDSPTDATDTRKTVKTALTAYALVTCRDCGAHLRRNFVKARVALRPVS